MHALMASRCGEPSSRWPTEAPASQNMEVNVGYRLKGIPATIKHRPIPIYEPFLLRNLLGHQKQVPHQMSILWFKMVQRRNRFSGYDQNMCRSLWIDVPECKTQAILKNNVRRNLSIRNPFKKRLLSHIKYSLVQAMWNIGFETIKLA